MTNIEQMLARQLVEQDRSIDELRDALIATGEHLQRLTDLTHALAVRAGEQSAAVGVPTSVKRINRALQPG